MFFTDVIKKYDDEIKELNLITLGSLLLSFAIIVGGGCFLGYFILGMNLNSTDWHIQIIPKITFALFLEIFAYLFFRFATNSRRQLIALLNERTTISMRLLALQISLLSKDEELAHHTTKELLKTDRANPANESEQSIIPTESEKAAKSFIDVLSRFFNSSNK